MCCKFTPNLVNVLKDRLVSEIRNESAQKLFRGRFNIEKVVEIAKTKDLAAANAIRLQGHASGRLAAATSWRCGKAI